MEDILRALNTIAYDDKNSTKADIICALGGVVATLNHKINKIIDTPSVELKVGQKVKLIEYDLLYQLKNMSWLVFKRYCYLKNEYHFTVVGSESKDGGAVEYDKPIDVQYESKNFPVHKNDRSNFEFHLVDNF